MECGFTLKCVRDMIRTYSQMHRTDKYSQHSSIIWSVWPSGWVFVYELSGCGFESRCSHLTYGNRFYLQTNISIKSKISDKKEFYKKFHGGNFLGGDFPGGNFRLGNFPGVIFPADIFPGRVYLHYDIE